MAKTVYDVHQVSTVGGETTSSIVAVIDGDKVTGPMASEIYKILQDHKMRHPTDPPDMVFCGDYCWAEKRLVPSKPS
jgi:hypothetical protein